MVAYIDYVYIIIYIYILLYTFIILIYMYIYIYIIMCNYLYMLTCIDCIFLSSTFPALFLGPGVPALHPATVRGLR